MAKWLASRDVKEPAELMAAAFFGALKLDKDEDRESASERAKRNAGHYARQAPKGLAKTLASFFGADRWSDEGRWERRDDTTCGEGRSGCEKEEHPVSAMTGVYIR